MAKMQKCECCGKIKTLSSNRGQLLCSSCVSLAGSVNTRIEAVAKMVRHQDQLPALLDALGIETKTQAMVESELLDKLAELVGYKGESGDELFATMQRNMDRIEELTTEIETHENFERDVRRAVGLSISDQASILQELATHRAKAEALDQLQGELSLPDDQSSPADIVSAVSGLLSELTERVRPTDRETDTLNQELESAVLTIDVLCRHLGLDASDPQLQYKDIVLHVAAGEAILEQCQRLLGLVFADQLAPALEELTEANGRLSSAKRRLAAEAMATAEQLAEAEQQLLAGEQIFTRIREALGDDSLDNAQLPSALDALLYASPTLPSPNRHALDSHLMDLLIEFPQIGVERVAVIREAA